MIWMTLLTIKGKYLAWLLDCWNFLYGFFIQLRIRKKKKREFFTSSYKTEGNKMFSDIWKVHRSLVEGSQQFIHQSTLREILSISPFMSSLCQKIRFNHVSTTYQWWKIPQHCKLFLFNKIKYHLFKMEKTNKCFNLNWY